MRGPHQERTRVGRDGRFELVEHVGSGGFGHVWRARDSVLAREVALKFLALDRLVGRRPNPERLAVVRDRFARESLIAAKVDSAFVARIYDCDIDGDEPFLVMEYVDGRPLSDYLGSRPLPLPAPAAGAARLPRALPPPTTGAWCTETSSP